MTQLMQLSVYFLIIMLLGCSTTAVTTKPDSLNDNASELQGAQQSPYSLITATVERDAKSKFIEAKRAIDNKKYKQAESPLLWLVEHYPQYSGPFLNLAIVYTKLDDNKAADHYFRQALSVNPLNLQGYNSYGIFLRNEGRFVEAEKTYLSGLAIWEKDLNSHKNLGILYELYMGKLPNALAQYQRYLELLSNSPESEQRAKEIKRINGWIIDITRRIKKTAKTVLRGVNNDFIS